MFKLLAIVCLSVGCLSHAASVGQSDKKPSSGHGNPTAADRLMKELTKIHRSENYKKGLYAVEPVGDSLFEWRVKLFPQMLDADSQLHSDLLRMKAEGKKDFVEMNFQFKGNFPFGPPFVRVVYPFMAGEHFYQGGALCMELLSPRGWSSAYKLEAVITDIALLLTEGKVSALEKSPAEMEEYYSLENAKKSYEWIWNTEHWGRNQKS